MTLAQAPDILPRVVGLAFFLLAAGLLIYAAWRLHRASSRPAPEDLADRDAEDEAGLAWARRRNGEAR